MLTWFALIVLIRQLSELTIPKKDEKQKYWSAISLGVLISTLVCIAHWIFAINYYEVAINSAVFIKWDTIDDRELAMWTKINDFKVYFLNLVYYSLTVISVLNFTVFVLKKDDHEAVVIDF